MYLKLLIDYLTIEKKIINNRKKFMTHWLSIQGMSIIKKILMMNYKMVILLHLKRKRIKLINKSKIIPFQMMMNILRYKINP